MGGAAYTFSGPGSPTLGRFSVDIVAPGDLTITTPDFPEAVSVAAGRDLVIQWTSTEPDQDVLVEVTAVKGHWICRFRDDGEAIVPANVFEDLTPAPVITVFKSKPFEFEIPCVEGYMAGVFHHTWDAVLEVK